MEFTKHNDILGVVGFFLDFEKAFDSVEWNYIQDTQLQLRESKLGKKVLKRWN